MRTEPRQKKSAKNVTKKTIEKIQQKNLSKTCKQNLGNSQKKNSFTNFQTKHREKIHKKRNKKSWKFQKTNKILE